MRIAIIPAPAFEASRHGPERPGRNRDVETILRSCSEFSAVLSNQLQVLSDSFGPVVYGSRPRARFAPALSNPLNGSAIFPPAERIRSFTPLS